VDGFETGYPNIAAFTDSSECFMLYRRFGYLQSRLLFDRQDELQVLEEELDTFDKDHQKYIQSRRASPLSDEAQARKDLLDRLEVKFTSYGN
jgi:hypothetical protein